MALRASDTMGVVPMDFTIPTALLASLSPSLSPSLSRTDLLVGAAIPAAALLVVLGLHLVIPARRVEGYARCEHTNALLRYRLNGRIVGPVTLGLWALACAQGWLAWDLLYRLRWPSLAGACLLGVSFSAWMVLTRPSRGGALLAELFLGRAENPQWLGARVDAKMFLYLYGAVMLALNLASFAAHHVQVHGLQASAGVLVHVGLFGWFLMDYLIFERVHLYTYDLFAERVGFKLGWGCLTFYPYFYAVGLWAVAGESPGLRSPAWLALSAAVFFTGWALSRGANLQKYSFKRAPARRFLGLIEPRIVSDGERHLLCSGFWGLSRHINYLGEILMGAGLTLALGHPEALLPWLYPLYYVALLVPRERDDDRRCAAKYGALWDEYRARVPRRIVPWLY